MKRFLALAVATACLVLPSAAAFADPTITVNSATVSPGALAVIRVGLNADATNVSGVELTVTPSVTPAGATTPALILDTPSALTKMSDGLFDSSATTGGGSFKAAFVRAQPFSGPVEIVALRFQVPANAAAGTIYTLAVTAKANDPDGQPIAVKTQPGTITVQ